MSLLTDIKDTFSNLLPDVSDDASEPLSMEEQIYANDLAKTLGEPIVTTTQDWVDLNKRQSDKIYVQDDLAYAQTLSSMMLTGTVNASNVSNMAKDMAVVSKRAESVEGIPDAAAIAAARKEIADAYYNNPEIAAETPEEIERNINYATKYAILVDHMQMALVNANNATGGKKFAYYFNQVAPIPFVAGGVSARTYKDALEAMGFKDVGYNPVANKRLFLGAVSKIYNDDTVSPMLFNEAMLTLANRAAQAGVNPLEIADLFSTVIEFNPELETFYAAIDILPWLSPAAKAVKAVKAGEAFLPAFKGIVSSSLKAANPVPGLDRPLAKLSDKLVDKVVAPVANRVSVVSKALRNKDRAKAIEATVEALGEPTQTARPFHRASKADAWEYGFDSTVHVETTAEGKVANTVPVVLTKNQKAIKASMEQAVNRVSMLKQFKIAAWNKEASGLIDTLKMSGIIGAGKGVGVDDIVSAFSKDNLLKTQEAGNLIAHVVLKGSTKTAEAATQRGFRLTKIAEGLDNIGLDYSIEKRNGRYLTHVNINTNKGWGTLYYNMLKGEAGKAAVEKWRPFLSSLFTVTSNPTDIQKLNIARNIDAAVLRSTGESAISKYKSLSKEDKKLMQAIADTELKYAAWYDSAELAARGVSDKIIEAHEAYRAMNDLDAFVMNEVRRQELVEKGAKTIKFNDEYMKGVGRVLPVQDEAEFFSWINGKEGRKPRDLMIDSLNGEIVSPDALSNEVLRGYYRKGYKLIEGSINPDEGIAAKSFYYLLNPDDLVVGNLGQFVTTYVAGGRRFFDRGAGFLKQLKLEKNASNRSVIVGANTFATDLDFIGLTRRAAVIEDIRKEVCKGNMQQATQMILDAALDKAPFHNAQEFVQWAEEVGMDVEHIENSLEVVKNGNMMNSYEKLKQAGIDDLVGFDDMYNLQHRSHFQAITSDSKMKKSMRTGKELLTYDFEAAQPVDIEMQMHYMVNDMVYGGVMHQYTEFYADRFDKLFRSVMVTPETGIKPTSTELLLHGTVKSNLTGAQADLAESARTAKANYAAVRGIPTAFDEAIAKKTDAMMRWVGGAAEELFHITGPASHKIRSAWQKFVNLDPLAYGRAFTSHWYLGMMNPSQLYKQMASDVSIFLIEPKATMKAVRYSLPFASALRKSDGNVLKALDKLATKFKDAPANVRTNFENLINMGVFEHGVAGGYLEAGQTVKSTLNKISMAPFNIGEMQNRTLAYLTAIYAKGMDGVKMTAEQLADVALYGQKLFMNMDATGLARIQTSTLGKTLLQFMGYRMRWLETALFDKGLTPIQRKRLLIGTSILVGGEGMLGTAAYHGITNYFNHYTDSNEPGLEERSEVARFIARGLLNYGSEMMGWDTDIAAPLSLDYLEGLDIISGLGQLDVPVVTALGKAMQGMTTVAASLYDTVYGESTIEDFENRLTIAARCSQLPSATRPLLGYIFWKTGLNYNSKGELTEVANGLLRPVLYGLGFNSLEMKDRIAAWTELAYAKNRVKEVVKAIKPLASMAADNPSKDLTTMIETIIQDSDLSIAQKADVYSQISSWLGETKGITLLQLLQNDQLKAGGFYGNNLIQLGDLYER